MSPPATIDETEGIEARIAALLAGELDEAERAHLEAEIDRNPRWLAVVAVLARETSRGPLSSAPDDTVGRIDRAHRVHVRPGTRIGRYVVTHELGRGGMGLVHAADDPMLGRTVALKLLRSDRDPERAIREARALARVRHPAVIEVFDVDRWQGRVVIAMELLVGKTLGAWRRTRTRSIAEVIAVFVAAGEGLVAAHRAGLVHRDFKPDNVIVTESGRVVVIDFGLAADVDTVPSTHASKSVASEPRTRSRIGGTPAYMAPEQQRGRRCDARVDQFAFAVALHEALHGRRPLQDPSTCVDPARGRVPPALDRAIAKALAEAPADRHESMDAFLSAVRRATHPPRRRAWIGGIAAAVLTLLGWRMTAGEPAGAVPTADERPDPPPAFEEIERLLSQIDPLLLAGDHDAALRIADDTVARAHATGDRGLLAKSLLARARAQRDAGDFAPAEADLRRVIDTPDGDERTIAQAYAELAWIVGYKQARHDEGRDLVRHAQAWTDRAGRPIDIELSWRRSAGWIEQAAGNGEAARQHFADALAIAEARSDDAELADDDLALCLNGLGAAALSVADIEGAQSALRRAATLFASTRGAMHPSVAEVRNNLAAILRARGELTEAIALFDTNLAAFTAAYGEQHLAVGQTLINRAVARLDLGDLAAAEADADRAIAVSSAAVGADHPAVAHAYTLRADARVQLHRPREALEDFARAHELMRQTLGPDHPSVGTIETGMGSAAYALDRFDEAVAHHREALRILASAWGERHPDLAIPLANLALAEQGRGDVKEAHALLQRALRIADGSAKVMVRTRLGSLLLENGDNAFALAMLEAAVADDDEQRDPVMRATTWFALARALRANKRERDRAAQLARDAHDLYTAAGEHDLAADVQAFLDARPR